MSTNQILFPWIENCFFVFLDFLWVNCFFVFFEISVGLVVVFIQRGFFFKYVTEHLHQHAIQYSPENYFLLYDGHRSRITKNNSLVNIV